MQLPEAVLIIDVEATCWQGPPPPGEQSEIIEIGACLLDLSTGHRAARRSILVRPARSRVSPFCTELTTLTQDVVDGGIELRQACRILREEYSSRERVWASYGAYDRKQFRAQCAAFGVEYPFGERHLNVKELVGRVYDLRRRPGMAGALRHLGLPLEGTHHRGGDDAWNIAAVLSRTITDRKLTLEAALELAGTIDDGAP